MVQVPNFKASGDINRSRFVVPSGTGTCAQAGAGSAPMGVSQRGTRDTPLPGASELAAAEGDSLQIYGDGERCPIEAGATIAANEFLKPDASGKAVPIEGGEAYYAQATAPANSGEACDTILKRGVAPTPTVSIAAAGSTQSDAALLKANSKNTVSGADGTKGVRLPVVLSGASARCVVYNEHASNGLKIYPATGGDINDGTANAAITIEGKTQAILECLDGTTWTATFTANS